MSSLLQGLRAIREGRDSQGTVDRALRQRPQINFVQVDPAEHERRVQAEREALMREREIEERTVARLKTEAAEQSRKANGQPKAKPSGRPRRAAATGGASPQLLQNSVKAEPVHTDGELGKQAGKAAQPQQQRNRYAHLHEDALAVWQYVAEHNDAALSLSEIAGVLGLTVSEVSHRLRQLENNGIVRRGYDGVITLLIQSSPSEASHPGKLAP